jgi:hypothetical protein
LENSNLLVTKLLGKSSLIMKKLLRLLFAATLLISINQGLLTQKAVGQNAPPPPPPPVDAKGSSGNRGPMDEGAPIGDGAWILITLVVGYGIHTFKVRKKTPHSNIE